VELPALLTLLALPVLLALVALPAAGCGQTLVVGTDLPDGAPGDGGTGPASLAQGLVAYWKLDDGPGVNRAIDSSGNQDHAIPQAVSGTDWLPAGRIGGALLFGNAGWLQGTASTSVNTIGGGLSIAMWIRLADLEDRQQVIMQRQAGTGADAHFLLDLRGGRPALAGLTIARCEAPALASGRWVHLAVTFDGARERLLYDGSEVAACASSGSFASDTTWVTVGGGQIGPSQFAVDRRLRADLDEVALWSRPLTTEEIRALAAGDVPPAP
jgi:hypothetical protein